MAESSISLKLLIDTSKDKRVLFAEADKDFVDFLFNILSLPVATIVRLLQGQGMQGSLPNLFQSLENLNDDYIQSNKTKDTFLKPVVAVSSTSLPLTALTYAPTQKNFYGCNNAPAHGFRSSSAHGFCFSSPIAPAHGSSNAFLFGSGFRSSSNNTTPAFGTSYVCYYVSDDPSAVCPNCGNKMTKALSYVKPPGVKKADSGGRGLVKGLVTYMVMDDLVVKPMSTISSVTLLNKFDIKELGALEEKVVNFGMNEAVKLLRAALGSKNVLTEVFC